jgi:hypothetical protein
MYEQTAVIKTVGTYKFSTPLQTSELRRGFITLSQTKFNLDTGIIFLYQIRRQKRRLMFRVFTNEQRHTAKIKPITVVYLFYLGHMSI